MKSGIKYNLITYFAFIVIALAGIFYGNALANRVESLRIWSYSNILLLLAVVPFLFLQSKAKLPDFWDTGISNISRLVIPPLIGIVFGMLDFLKPRLNETYSPAAIDKAEYWHMGDVTILYLGKFPLS